MTLLSYIDSISKIGWQVFRETLMAGLCCNVGKAF
jgi:hypothetical protein